MKRINKIKRSLLCVFVLLLSVHLCSMNAGATNIIYSVSVTPEQQYMSNWCWAACARMAGKTMYNASSRSQFAIVNFLKGDSLTPYPNVQGTIDDCKNGSEYVAYYHKSFSYTTSAWGFPSIENHIANGKPVQADWGHYPNGYRQGGHMVIITGTAHVEDSTGSYWFIQYIDPDDGLSHSMSYSGFCHHGTDNYDWTVYVSN